MVEESTIAVGCILDAYCLAIGTKIGSTAADWYYKKYATLVMRFLNG